MRIGGIINKLLMLQKSDFNVLILLKLHGRKFKLFILKICIYYHRMEKNTVITDLSSNVFSGTIPVI